jgi:hypothetical protein
MPFFQFPVPTQRQEVEGLLAGWRENGKNTKQRSTLGDVYRTKFGQILSRLIRGEDRGNSPYIWAPVDALRTEQGLRDTKPVEFLAVAQWLLGLQKLYRQPELGALFALRSGN